MPNVPLQCLIKSLLSACWPSPLPRAGSGSAVNNVKSAEESVKILSNFQKLKEAVKSNTVVQKGIEAWKATEPARDLVKQGKAIDFAVNQIYTEEDMLRLAAMVASLLDPTGVASVVSSYSYAKCNKLIALR